jgi:hypothetical protein
MTRKLLFSFIFLLLLTFSGHLSAQNLTEEQKIERLISYVANLKNAKFIRNGEAHEAKKAAEHLTMKREKAGSRVKTALDFIEKVASKSYFSGDFYQIKFADGKIEKSGDVLRRELARIEKK